MKNVAGQTLGVNPHQRRSGRHIAHHEGDSFLHNAVSIRAGLGAETVDPERAPAGGEICGRDWLHCVSAHTLIIAAAE